MTRTPAGRARDGRRGAGQGRRGPGRAPWGWAGVLRRPGSRQVTAAGPCTATRPERGLPATSQPPGRRPEGLPGGRARASSGLAGLTEPPGPLPRPPWGRSRGAGLILRVPLLCPRSRQPRPGSWREHHRHVVTPAIPPPAQVAILSSGPPSAVWQASQSHVSTATSSFPTSLSPSRFS